MRADAVVIGRYRQRGLDLLALAETGLAEVDEHRVGAVPDRPHGLRPADGHFPRRPRAREFPGKTIADRVGVAAEEIGDLLLRAAEPGQLVDLLRIDVLEWPSHTLSLLPLHRPRHQPHQAEGDEGFQEAHDATPAKSG